MDRESVLRSLRKKLKKLQSQLVRADARHGKIAARLHAAAVRKWDLQAAVTATANEISYVGTERKVLSPEAREVIWRLRKRKSERRKNRKRRKGR